MQELVITPSTIVFLAIIAVLAVLAVHRLVKRGTCDCHDHCDGGCSRYDAVDDMVRKMEAAAKKLRVW